MSNVLDVIVVGAGPVGLFVACELALAGVSVVVLERDVRREWSIWKDGPLGRRGLQPTSVEAFHRRGLLGKLLNAENGEDYQRAFQLNKTPGFQFAGHFGGLMLDGNRVDFSRYPYHLPGPAFLPVASTSGHVESVLTERARELGVDIRRGSGIDRLSNDDSESVKVWAGDECFIAQWLVGCDGGRSTLCKLAGIDFVGTEDEFIGYITECELDRPELLKPGFNPTDTGMYICIGGNQVYACDFDMSFDRSQDVTPEHFTTVLQRLSGTEVVVKKMVSASTFTARLRQAKEYCKGRILLAGDSAHVHSPLGAQGLHTGIGDAMNLGWKLAAAVKGVASPSLLDTYHNERHPVGATVLDWCRAQVSIIRPDPLSNAMQKLMRDIVSSEYGTTWFVDKIWGLSQRYDFGEENSHDIVGRSAPDIAFQDGSRLGDKLVTGQWVVVAFEANAATAQFVESLSPMIGCVDCGAQQTFGLEWLLVRPDGIVADASTKAIETQTLKGALSRWLQLGSLHT